MDLSQCIAIVAIIIVIVYGVIRSMRTTPASHSTSPSSSASSSGTKLINFFASFCPHSRRFRETWDEVTPQLNAAGIETQLVDCDNDKDTCRQYEVPHFPYMIKQSNGQTEVYNGNRTAEDVMSFAKN
tara:strand:- start:103 stop:486 length:384 start_codon:yes stop_codon:yes gene_type:complete